MVSCLFLLDCKNILISLKSTFGQESRIDFKKLLELAWRDSEGKRKDAIAYIDIESEWISLLSQLLSTVGFKVKWYGPHIGGESLLPCTLTVDCMKVYKDFDRITVASGRGDLTPLYDFLRSEGKEVEVIGFEKCISSQIPKFASTCIALDESILLGSVKHED